VYCGAGRKRLCDFGNGLRCEGFLGQVSGLPGFSTWMMPSKPRVLLDGADGTWTPNGKSGVGTAKSKLGGLAGEPARKMGIGRGAKKFKKREEEFHKK